MAQENAVQQIQVEVPPEAAGERFDKVIARLANISRQRAMALLEEGKVHIGRRRPKKGERAEAGMKLSIELPESEAPVPQPDLPLVVLHEDPLLLALDKPSGISMHPLEAGELGTLANALIARYPDVTGASTEERCPGLVHRLDRETSGVVLWARQREAFDNLRAQFAAKTVEKRYYALVDGFVEGVGELTVPLAHDPFNDKKMLATPYPAEADEFKARPAITRYRALGIGQSATLVEVEIPTGVMHQIRAHFAFVGYPVLGDTLYGGRTLEGIHRHLLHAASIEFDHPDGSGRKRIDAKLPADFIEGLAKVGIQPPV
jgi:23S rRNA pseudouridine1911/1915/1917 synthase